MAVNDAVGWSYGYLPNQWEDLGPEGRARVKALNSGPVFKPMGSSNQPSGSLGVGTGMGLSGVGGATGTDLVAPSADTGVAANMTGGVASYAAPATRDLATAPEWLAYLSALGLEESMARADVDRMRGLYQSEAERLKQDLIPQYNQQRRGIAGSMETRGMVRSGEYLRRLAENRAQQGRQTAGIEANLAGQVSGLESQLAQKMASLGSQRAQQEMALRSQGYV